MSTAVAEIGEMPITAKPAAVHLGHVRDLLIANRVEEATDTLAAYCRQYGFRRLPAGQVDCARMHLAYDTRREPEAVRRKISEAFRSVFGSPLLAT